MSEHNYLLGRGELLAGEVHISPGGGPKNPPYSPDEAKQRVRARLESVVRILEAAAPATLPNGRGVANLTVHPRYISKSDFPAELLGVVGLELIGTRPRRVTPEEWGIKRHPNDAITDDLFVAGEPAAFRAWEEMLPDWPETHKATSQLALVEDLRILPPEAKLRGVEEGADGSVVLEVVLHNARRQDIISAWDDYASGLEADTLLTRARSVGGLTFVPVVSDYANLIDLARFTFLRVLRPMPQLRPARPRTLLRTRPPNIVVPDAPSLDESLKVVIFDGGIPVEARSSLDRWVTLVEPPGIGPADPEAEEHGLQVTSAFLFGDVDSPSLRTPIAKIDHVRVLDDDSENTIEAVDVLERILDRLDDVDYDFVNLSVGPCIPIDDDEVTEWTSALDQRLASTSILVTAAAGNDGELDSLAGLDRVQPPADGVNVLGVGARDCLIDAWDRAPYSSRGPGRSPGRVKPDGLAFGGSDEEPFRVLGWSGGRFAVDDSSGTSLAAPLALRAAASIAAGIGSEVNGLAIRALLIHRCEPDDFPLDEVGWGAFQVDPVQLLTCADNEAIVLFQGSLPLGRHLRVPIPMPDGIVAGKVAISATLVIAPTTDPELPTVYTRGGYEVSFRPHRAKFTTYANGTTSAEPKSETFFSASRVFGSELEARGEGVKWEPCMHARRTFLAASLNEPAFDISYHYRERGAPATATAQTDYAFIVGIRAAKQPDLYEQIAAKYARVLQPLVPAVDLRVRL